MPWVTINGNHILIGEDDDKGGSAIARARREVQQRKAAERTKKLVDSVRHVEVHPGAKRSPEILNDLGHQQGYKDVSNYVNGPAHTRHALPTRIAKQNRAINEGVPFREQHWWQGYRQGSQRAVNDWQDHLSKSTGGQLTRAYRRLRAIKDKI